MKPSLITIIALSLVSILVVGLMVFAYIQIIKSVRILTKNGLLDDECLEDKRHKTHRVGTIIINVISGTLTTLIVLSTLVGACYKINGEQFVINNKTAMVVASNSMEDYISDEYKDILINNVIEYKGYSYDEALEATKASQFNVGDMLEFTLINDDTDLELYKIY